MKLLNDGGPAFPARRGPNVFEGMTLRDYFAGCALQGLSACPAFTTVPWSVLATWAYDRADAMLTEREKTTECAHESVSDDLIARDCALVTSNSGGARCTPVGGAKVTAAQLAYLAAQPKTWPAA